MNTGLEDARNLAWKLAAVPQRIAKSIETDPEFLERFDPTVDRAAFERTWQGRADGAVGEVNAFGPHYEGSPVVAGARGAVSSAVGSHSFEARAGHHLVPAAMACSARASPCSPWTPTPTPMPCRPSAGPPPTCDSAHRDRRGETARYDARLVLVRPDHFVTWTSAAPTLAADEVRRLLHTITGRPAPDRAGV